MKKLPHSTFCAPNLASRQSLDVLRRFFFRRVQAFLFAALLALLPSPAALAEESAGAPPPVPQGPTAGEAFFQMVPMLAIFIAVMYLFVFRPQQKQEREKRTMLENIKKNDRVVTAGGLHGIVNVVKNETVILTVADNVHMKFNKSAIQSVLKKSSPEADDSSSPESSEEKSKEEKGPNKS